MRQQKQLFMIGGPNLLFIWIASAELAIERVKQRVVNGGHAIPAKVIQRRYFRSIDNFKEKYLPIADRWMLCDNSSHELAIIAEKYTDLEIYDPQAWEKFSEASL